MNIIVADDHPMFRKGLADTLRSIENIRFVAEAADGTAIIKLLEISFHHVVFMGIRMKGMDADVIAKTIHQRFPEVKTIALGQFDDTFAIRKMFLANCCGYIAKTDCEKPAIVKALTEVLSGKKYFNDTIAEKLTGESEEDCFKRLSNQYSLTKIDFELIRKICAGKSSKEIADEMNFSAHTIDNYKSNVYHKVGVSSSVTLMHFAIRHRIIDIETLS